MRRVLWISGIGAFAGVVSGWLDTRLIDVMGLGGVALFVIAIAFVVRWIDRGAHRTVELEIQRAQVRAWRTWTWALAIAFATLASSLVSDRRFEQRRTRIAEQVIPHLDSLLRSGRGLPVTSRLEWDAETRSLLDDCRVGYVRPSDTAYELSITHSGTEATWVYSNATQTWTCVPNGIP